LQQAQLCTKRAAMHHIQIAEGTTGAARESKISSTQIDETSLETFSSFLSIDEQGNIMPKTPEAALVEAQTYMYTTQPNPRVPREHMH
jgi:hypothetical protein